MSEFVYRIASIAHLLIKSLSHGRLPHNVLSPMKKVGAEFGCKPENAIGLWETFIESSTVDVGEYTGFHYAGYVLEKHIPILDSWIWTNAALVRFYVSEGYAEKAKTLALYLEKRQLICGGWVVRNDYDQMGEKPIIAPNDSAYIANNAFLTLYKATKNEHYLKIAERCADWIMKTRRKDGLVYTGFNVRDGKWEKDYIIVDTGFTAGLFANLYELTGNEAYKRFLSSFIMKYVELFYDNKKMGFVTSIDANGRHVGGCFSRGQAWALEGLIPAYFVLKDDYLRIIIENCISNLLRNQNSDGSWSYNLSRKFMGDDCKGVPVIAKSIAIWAAQNKDVSIMDACRKAVCWCYQHTCIDHSKRGEIGGIFSFCVEGAIVTELYTSCAFVYSSVYAIELKHILDNESR